MELTLFMFGAGFIFGMIFVWAFGIAHDVITNWYRKQVYDKELEKEKKRIQEKSEKE